MNFIVCNIHCEPGYNSGALETSKNGEANAGTRRESFDASGLLRRFKDFDFGEVKPNAIQLSIRYSTRQEDGYYDSASVLPLAKPL